MLGCLAVGEEGPHYSSSQNLGPEVSPPAPPSIECTPLPHRGMPKTTANTARLKTNGWSPSAGAFRWWVHVYVWNKKIMAEGEKRVAREISSSLSRGKSRKHCWNFWICLGTPSLVPAVQLIVVLAIYGRTREQYMHFEVQLLPSV